MFYGDTHSSQNIIGCGYCGLPDLKGRYRENWLGQMYAGMLNQMRYLERFGLEQVRDIAELSGGRMCVMLKVARQVDVRWNGSKVKRSMVHYVIYLPQHNLMNYQHFAYK